MLCKLKKSRTFEKERIEVKIFTIGFTKKNAEEFFSRLTKAGVKTLIDIRLNNRSQLAGFAKEQDLRYFLKAIADIDYIYRPEWAPTQEVLDSYKKHKNSWQVYEASFNKLIADRKIERFADARTLDRACLLCSEDTPEHCHRRLVAEYLQGKIEGLEICHL
jgi:uncharacterized protein (DUF488 family)